MTGTDIHETLHEIGRSVDAPPLDRVTFQAEVRRERRRRATGRLLLVGAAAACVGLVATVGGELLPEPAPRPAPSATSPADGEVGGVVYAVVDDRLVSWDGVTSTRLGPVEGVLGFTQERVWALDRDSRTVSTEVVDDPEGAQPAGFTDGPSPYDEPVQSAALSDDGRYLGWVALDASLTVYDLRADAVAWTVDAAGADSRYLVDVSAEGALVSDCNELTVHRADGSAFDLRPSGGTSGLESQLGPGRVMIAGPGGGRHVAARRRRGRREGAAHLRGDRGALTGRSAGRDLHGGGGRPPDLGSRHGGAGLRGARGTRRHGSALGRRRLRRRAAAGDRPPPGGRPGARLQPGRAGVRRAPRGGGRDPDQPLRQASGTPSPVGEGSGADRFGLTGAFCQDGPVASAGCRGAPHP